MKTLMKIPKQKQKILQSHSFGGLSPPKHQVLQFCGQILGSQNVINTFELVLKLREGQLRYCITHSVAALSGEIKQTAVQQIKQKSKRAQKNRRASGVQQPPEARFCIDYIFQYAPLSPIMLMQKRVQFETGNRHVVPWMIFDRQNYAEIMRKEVATTVVTADQFRLGELPHNKLLQQGSQKKQLH